MSRTRISLFLMGFALIVCGLVFIPQSQATIRVNVSDKDISGIVVGGPISTCADCACPNCWGTMCYSAGYDPLIGYMCEDKDAWNFHEDCNCDGWGFKSPYCHILTLVDCTETNVYQKNPDSSCIVVDPQFGIRMPCSSGGHSYLGSTTDPQTYDECTETSSNPHY